MALFLRTTNKDGRSRGGFQWPMEIGATVTAPDWKPTNKCGNGLHGLLDGLGDAEHLSFDADAIWWIVEAEGAIDLDGKHKFQSCKIVAFGPRHEVTQQLYALRPGAIHGLTATAGDYGTATAGYRGTATVGDYGTATAGYRGTLIFLRWINGRRRVLAAYVGENGIEPNKPYRANDDHTAVIPA